MILCPNCGKIAARKSAWHSSDATAWRVFLSPYRCDSCGHRFLKISSRMKSRAAVTIVVLVTSITVGGLISFISSRGAAPDGAAIDQSAEKTLLPLAKKGNTDAAFRLALAYKDGHGVKENYAEAAKWFRKAAEQGHADAQFNLGLLYETGRGSLQNFSEAAKWFEKAAIQNNADAQYHLGLMYKRGQGIPIDNIKAYVWFNLAAAQAHNIAAEARDSVMLSMTQTQIHEAQKESNAWTPGTKPKSAHPAPPPAPPQPPKQADTEL